MKRKIIVAILLPILLASCTSNDYNVDLPKETTDNLYNKNVEMFILAEYDYPEDFGGYNLGVYLGEVNEAERAAEVAEEFWISKYGQGVVNWRPYTVQYNEKWRLWHVISREDPAMVGGVFHAVIDGTTGELLDYYVEE